MHFRTMENENKRKKGKEIKFSNSGREIKRPKKIQTTSSDDAPLKKNRHRKSAPKII